MDSEKDQISYADYRELLVKYFYPHKSQGIILAILLFISIGLQLVNPLIVRDFIDAAQNSAPLETTIKLALSFIGLALIQQAATATSWYFSENIAWKATNTLRYEIAKHALALSMTFHKGRTPGEMIERLDGDVTTLSNFFSRFIIQLAGNFLLLVGIVIFMGKENIWIGISFGVFIGLSLLMLNRFRNIAEPHWEAEREASAQLFGFLEERLGGTEDIRANGARSFVLHHFYRLLQILMNRSVTAALMINIMIVMVMFMFGLGTALGLGFSGNLFLNGTISLGTVYLVFHYTNMLEQPIRAITRQMEDFQRANAGIKRINEILSDTTKLPNPGINAVPTSEKSLGLNFDKVTFGYDDRTDKKGNTVILAKDQKETILDGISFKLEPGTTLGLLGRTGSGKTSLTRLIFRLYDPDNGIISLQNESDSVALPTIPLTDLRSQIGMVTQDIQLFNASVRDNLTFFDPSIPDQQIIAEIQALGMGDWLASLPDGINTELESGGSGLSAGQAQLLAFTRIFLQEPKIIILDEASSRLDPVTEELIERAVDRLIKERTAIIIAHRLHTVQRADQIMILERGKIVEFGQREALANNPKSKFAQLLKSGIEEVLV